MKSSTDVVERRRLSTTAWFRMGGIGLALFLFGELIYPLWIWIIIPVLVSQLGAFELMHFMAWFFLIGWILKGVGMSLGGGLFEGYPRLLASTKKRWTFEITQVLVWIAIGVEAIFRLVFVFPVILLVFFGQGYIFALQTLMFIAQNITPFLLDVVLILWGITLVKIYATLRHQARDTITTRIAGILFLVTGVVSLLWHGYYMVFGPAFLVILFLLLLNTILNLVRFCLLAIACIITIVAILPMMRGES